MRLAKLAVCLVHPDQCPSNFAPGFQANSFGEYSIPGHSVERLNALLRPGTLAVLGGANGRASPAST